MSAEQKSVPQDPPGYPFVPVDKRPCGTHLPLMARRTLLCLPLIGLLAKFGSATAQSDEIANVEIRADQAAKDQVFATAALARLNVAVDASEDARSLQRAAPKTRAVPIIYLITGVIAVVVILEMIQELVRRTEYGGVIIDLRKVPPLITNDVKVPAGLVFVVAPSGSVSKYTGDDLSLAALQGLLTHK